MKQANSILAYVLAALLTGAAFAEPVAMTVSIDAKSPGAQIPDDFSGFSYETKMMLPDKNGKHLFSPDNKPLIQIFKTLGIKNFRIGGNSCDNPAIAMPSNQDIDDLFAFANAAGMKVMYTLRLKGTEDAGEIGPAAKYIMDHYRDDLICLALGNEPNIYERVYEPFVEKHRRLMSEIVEKYSPDAKFSGPGTTPGKNQWSRDYANDMSKAPYLKMITQHAYPGGSSRRVPDDKTGRENMLGEQWLKGYQKFHDVFVPAVLKNGLTFRLEEANSYFFGGVEGASDTFTSALWVLDFMHWWASHDAAGVNFHSGDFVAVGDTEAKSMYAAFWMTDHGIDAHPLGYGLKAFDLGGHGKVTPVNIESKEKLNLTAYATLNADGEVLVTLINKSHEDDAGAAAVTLKTGGRIISAKVVRLAAPKRDVTAKTGVTLGDGTIHEGGTWDGKWADLPATKDDAIMIEVPASSAAVVRLATK